MEIATGDYGPQNHKLVKEMNNGRNMSYRKPTNPSADNSVDYLDNRNAIKFPIPTSSPLSTDDSNQNPFDYKGASCTVPANSNQSKSAFGRCSSKRSSNVYGTPFYRQLSILLLRTFLILWRDKSLTFIRFGTNLATAFIIGFLYYNIGNDAGNVLNSFRYCFYSIMFIMYTAFSSILVKCKYPFYFLLSIFSLLIIKMFYLFAVPLELPIVSREHFNRWYSLRAYYLAITLADIPIQLICTVTYITITYILTSQPPELFRLVLFCNVVFLTALVGQSIGLTIGASLDIKVKSSFSS